MNCTTLLLAAGILHYDVFICPLSVHHRLYVTWSLRRSVSSWYSASWFFHCSTLLLASCSAATSLALLSCRVKSSASRFISHMDLRRSHKNTQRLNLKQQSFISIWCWAGSVYGWFIRAENSCLLRPKTTLMSRESEAKQWAERR